MSTLYTQASPITAVPPERIWQAHIGARRTPIEDMDDEHLINTISMIERGTDRDGRMIPEYCYAKMDYLKEEAAKRRIRPKEDGWDI